MFKNTFAVLIVAALSIFSLSAMEEKKVGKLKIPAAFNKIDAKPVTPIAATLEIPEQHKAACQMLMDAYTNKKNSRYYKHIKNAWNMWAPHIETALKKKDPEVRVQDCALLIANNALHTTPKQDLLYQALQVGCYPFCYLLLTTGLVSAQHNDDEHKTPLYCLLAHASALPRCDLFALCELLRHYGADINKPLKDGRSTLESLATNLDLQNFYCISPVLRQLGASPELPDEQGFTTMHRLARSKDIDDRSLTNVIIPYHAHMVHPRAVLTVLLIHKHHRESLIGKVPKAVVCKHIIPHICPFSFRLLEITVNQQLDVLRTLLTAKTKLERTPKDILTITGHIFHNSDKLDPQKVEQHREAFTKATRELMAALDAPCSK